MSNLLGMLEKVDLRKVWAHEAFGFTPWLAEENNLGLLSKSIGMELELIGKEVKVGAFFADILCVDHVSSGKVLIENQLEKTDHSHLGQIITYASGLEAKTIIWVAAKFTDEHRSAIDWLNEITHDEWSFFAVEIELWKINDSLPAPMFNIVACPNKWSRSLKEAIDRKSLSVTEAKNFDFWSGFQEFRAESGLRCPKPAPQTWLSFSVGRTGFSLETTIHRKECKFSVRLYIICDDVSPKEVFDKFAIDRSQIEAEVGSSLVWNRLPDKKGAIISIEKQGCKFECEDDWLGYYKWISDSVDKMNEVFSWRIKAL